MVLYYKTMIDIRIRKLMKASLLELECIPGIGHKKALSIYNFYRNKDNIALIERLFAKGVRIYE